MTVDEGEVEESVAVEVADEDAAGSGDGKARARCRRGRGTRSTSEFARSGAGREALARPRVENPSRMNLISRRREIAQGGCNVGRRRRIAAFAGIGDMRENAQCAVVSLADEGKPGAARRATMKRIRIRSLHR
ncbi:MAG TPA: hypothetical protein VIK91_25980 [Nannocystis sp.]